MAILLKSNALFLHVPKTGGNWVSDVLEANDLVFAHLGGKHAGPPQLAPLAHLLDTPRRYDRPNRTPFTFCFVRHPLRWYESWYRMNSERDWPDWAADDNAWNPSVELNGLGARTFEGFVENVLRHRAGFLTRMYRFYAADAHFVGHQEHLAEDLITALALLRVEFDDAARITPTQPFSIAVRTSDTQRCTTSGCIRVPGSPPSSLTQSFCHCSAAISSATTLATSWSSTQRFGRHPVMPAGYPSRRTGCDLRTPAWRRWASRTCAQLI